MNKWELWWANVAFEDNPQQVKRRPVIVIDNQTAIIIAVKITSHEPRPQFSGEYKLAYWCAAGLSKESTARCEKLIRLQQQDFLGKIGRLHPVDIAALQSILRKHYGVNT